MKEIEAVALANWLANADLPKPVLVDVREDSEVEICQIPGSIHIPMYLIPTRLDELKKEAPIVCICHHGARSARVARFLIDHGYAEVINLVGGIDAWAMQVDPMMKKY